MDNDTTISKIVELGINQKHINVALQELKIDLISIKNMHTEHSEMMKNMHYKLEHQCLTGKKVGTWIITITGILTASQFLLRWILK